MKKIDKLSKKEKYFAIILFAGFLLKYNYLLLRIFYVPSITGIVLRNILFALLFVKFLLPLIHSREGRLKLFFFSFIFTVLFMSNYWYNRYFGNYLSFFDIVFGERTGSFSMVEVLIKQIIKIYDLFFILDIILLFVLLFMAVPIEKTIKNHKIFSEINLDFSSMMISGFLVVVLLFSQIFLTNIILGGNNPVGLYRKGTSEFVNVYGILPLYLFESSKFLNIDKIKQKKVKPTSDIPYYKKQKQLSDVDLIDKNSNIIFIQVESLDEKMIGYTHNGKEITPFLNSLKEKNMYFENFYAQKVNGSFDADLSVLTSLYPVNKSYVFKEIDMANFSSLPKMLKNRGYSTLAFHGNVKTFFNRSEAYPDLGFDVFYSEEDFDKNNSLQDGDDKTLGINDYDFFDQSVDYLAEAEKPFFAYFITLTSHTPFNFYPEAMVRDKFSDIDNIFVRDYFRSVNFVDKSLQMFFKKLEKNDLMENTVVVIYADHESEIDTSEYYSGIDLETIRNIKAPYHIPLFIIHDDIGAELSSKYGTTTDIAPTVLDIMGWDTLPQQFVGSSLLLEQEKPLLFLHENPQVLYKEQLFVKKQNEFLKIGYLEGRENSVQLKEEQTENIAEIIEFMRKIFLTTETVIPGGE
ncbi:LTA synthase family protein [Halanaerobium sp. MA284_MarDTE_T2]|uniref:LTA synthase family protein n=1 Tax=Halanaerobium sp. MA284_MarDTE_T2 TaxID=2183913 RepID=UPI000DF2ABDC|nr:LTA synthase family protein [Halanaerobium sp. MA284_MarDTE_T2]RCW49900.1 phosphoglycerol transferase MdoB-like AlkP superfamily enzyme [Halanaerobium sp. MA284_MarDTE_T2]